MKRYSILVITLLFFTLFFSCQEGEILKSSLNQTSESFLTTNYDSVIFYADENLKQNLGNSQDYYSYYLRAYAYSKLKDYRRSSDDYLKALEVIPEDKQYHVDRYQIMSNIGGLCKIHANYDLAIEYYKDALEYVGDKDRAGLLFNP